MTTATTQTGQATIAPDQDWYQPFRMSIEQYERLVDSDVFTKHDKLQLINGILVTKLTKKPPHVVATELCRDALKPVIPPGWSIRTESPVQLPPSSEPEPDVCVVRGIVRDYSNRHPRPADVGLLVEISDRTLGADRQMARIYGAGAIAICWIINLVDRQVEVFTSPTPEGYRVTRVFKSGEVISVVLDGVEVGHIAVDDMLP